MSDDIKKNVNDDFPDSETLIEFPARFPIKAMGKNDASFRAAILKIAKETIPEKDLISIDERPSKNDQFLAFTITAMFYDKPSIDKVYFALTKDSSVLMAI